LYNSCTFFQIIIIIIIIIITIIKIIIITKGEMFHVPDSVLENED